MENGSDSGVRNITPDEYRTGWHFAYEAVSHWFYQVFERKHFRKPTYNEWREYQREWRSKRSFDEQQRIVRCPVCAEHINESHLAGRVPFSMSPEEAEALRLTALPRTALTMRIHQEAQPDEDSADGIF